MPTSTAIPGTITSISEQNAAFSVLPSGSVYTQAGRLPATSPTATFSLSLANGMTAGFGVQDGNITNPLPFAGTYGGNPKLAPNRIGFIRNMPGTLPPDVNGQSPIYVLYFIFNPNQIVASFQMNSGQIPPIYLYGSGDAVSSAITSLTPQNGGGVTTQSNVGSANVPNLANSQTISWSLLFDRTYDMLYDTNPGENRGVLRDVAALYNIMATFDSQGATPVSTPCQVVFGQTVSGQLWGFTGFISSVNITYGIFRANMIPSRCEVDLSMTASYVAAAIPSTGGGAAAASPNAPLTTPAGAPLNLGGLGGSPT